MGRLKFYGMSEALVQTQLPFPLRRGKVRDVYELGERLLIVATDRISAFDCIMPNGIPDKGPILTALSLFWLEKLHELKIASHLIESDWRKFPSDLRRFQDQVARRSMLVRKASVIPIECVARGYLAGSGWKEYRKTQTVCGLPLPPGLRQCEKLPEPIFTPATKEESGHDINISFEETAKRVGGDVAAILRDTTLRIYAWAARYAQQRGVIIADTKLEFGALPDGQILLIDEVLTPDSSRFWPAASYEPGHDQPSFDKQFVRNWLEAQPWDKKPPAPKLPPDVVQGTRQRYLEAYQLLTGQALAL